MDLKEDDCYLIKPSEKHIDLELVKILNMTDLSVRYGKPGLYSIWARKADFIDLVVEKYDPPKKEEHKPLYRRLFF